MGHGLRYAWNVALLLAAGHITWRAALHGLRQRPGALVGRKCSYVVDPDFE